MCSRMHLIGCLLLELGSSNVGGTLRAGALCVLVVVVGTLRAVALG